MIVCYIQNPWEMFHYGEERSDAYNAFVEECKVKAKAEIYGEDSV